MSNGVRTVEEAVSILDQLIEECGRELAEARRRRQEMFESDQPGGLDVAFRATYLEHRLETLREARQLFVRAVP